MPPEKPAAAAASTHTLDIKKKIVEAASRLYASKGWANTSVEDIAAEARISAAVTYQFVKNVSSIMKMIMEDILFQFQEQMKPSLKEIEDPKEKLILAINLYYQIVDMERDKALLVYQESKSMDREARKRIMALEVETANIFREIVEEGVAKGVFTADDPDLVAYNIMMLSHIWALKGWHFRKRLELQDFIKHQKEFVVRALGGE